ncbi:MAG: hypothetical protein JOZ62_18785, partial [Acidobacteriaceae bacterium]|nr:hypothetical protein [Acidobacteriaceae bacterium]
MDEPNKNGKFSLADVEERKSWNRYMSAYNNRCSPRGSPLTPGLGVRFRFAPSHTQRRPAQGSKRGRR